MLAVAGRDVTRRVPHGGRGCVSIPDLLAGGVRLALATIFTQSDADPTTCPYAYRGRNDVEGAATAGWRQVEAYRMLEASGALRIVRCREELPALDAPVPDASDVEAPLAVVLLMEGADPIRDAADAKRWHDAGVRAVGLTWAMGSRHAGGDSTGGGLTETGRELVAAFDELGMIHDVSHLAVPAVDELLSLARGPVVASHSNARALVAEHDRHLHDRHIVAIAERGGVIGLNLYTRFLRKDRRATIDDAVAHVERVAEFGGVAATGLGSDMDGGFDADKLPIGLDAPRRLPALLDALAATGWRESDLAAFAAGNWLRVLRSALPSRQRDAAVAS